MNGFWERYRSRWGRYRKWQLGRCCCCRRRRRRRQCCHCHCRRCRVVLSTRGMLAVGARGTHWSWSYWWRWTGGGRGDEGGLAVAEERVVGRGNGQRGRGGGRGGGGMSHSDPSTWIGAIVVVVVMVDESKQAQAKRKRRKGENGGFKLFGVWFWLYLLCYFTSISRSSPIDNPSQRQRCRPVCEFARLLSARLLSTSIAAIDRRILILILITPLHLYPLLPYSLI